MGIRRQSRECALQMLYQSSMGNIPVEKVLENFWDCVESSERARGFAEDLAKGVETHLDEIDSLIACNSTNWRLSRMASVDKNILRVAVFEMLYRPDIPLKVTINEAVEIAKLFGTHESGAFVNGILDNIAKGLDREREAEVPL